MSMLSSQRDRRAMLLLIGAVAFFLTYKYLLGPIASEYGVLKEDVVTQRAALATDLGLLQQASEYPVIFGKSDSTLQSLTPRLFTDQDDMVATLALQQYVGSQATSSSVAINKTQTRPVARRPDGIRMLEITVDAEGDLEGVMKLLQRLETGPKIVQITALNLNPGQSSNATAAVKEVLNMSATVVGYAIDTAIVRGLVRPPPVGGRGRGRAGGE